MPQINSLDACDEDISSRRIWPAMPVAVSPRGTLGESLTLAQLARLEGIDRQRRQTDVDFEQGGTGAIDAASRAIRSRDRHPRFA